jgi:hypothetical protein
MKDIRLYYIKGHKVVAKPLESDEASYLGKKRLNILTIIRKQVFMLFMRFRLRVLRCLFKRIRSIYKLRKTMAEIKNIHKSWSGAKRAYYIKCRELDHYYQERKRTLSALPRHKRPDDWYFLFHRMDDHPVKQEFKTLTPQRDIRISEYVMHRRLKKNIYWLRININRITKLFKKLMLKKSTNTVKLRMLSDKRPYSPKILKTIYMLIEKNNAIKRKKLKRRRRKYWWWPRTSFLLNYDKRCKSLSKYFLYKLLRGNNKVKLLKEQDLDFMVVLKISYSPHYVKILNLLLKRALEKNPIYILPKEKPRVRLSLRIKKKKQRDLLRWRKRLLEEKRRLKRAIDSLKWHSDDWHIEMNVANEWR